jgi:hypothetical protein
MSQENKNCFIIVDAMNLFHRAKYVAKGDATMKSGLALHIMLSSIRKAWNEFKGTHVIFCLEGHSWRYNIYPQYKAHRKLLRANQSEREKEEDEILFEVFNSFVTFLKEKTNVTVLQQNGVEADDFIARWIDLHPNDDHVIVSGDTDFIQLMSPNVRIYDGVKGHVISINGIIDDKGKPVINKKTKKPDMPLPAEWALFKKIMRGDVSDNIMSAYPGVRETKLKEAFDDRNGKGFSWNNLMLQTWKDIDGDDVRVLDRYNLNKQLIDLRAQPQEIKEKMDNTVMEAVSKKKVSQVGIWFLRFCEEQALINIAKSPQSYSTFLSESYLKS